MSGFVFEFIEANERPKSDRKGETPWFGFVGADIQDSSAQATAPNKSIARLDSLRVVACDLSGVEISSAGFENAI